MALAQMRVTVRHVTVGQLVDELQKMSFAGYRDCIASFHVAGDISLTVMAEKDLLARKSTAAAKTPAPTPKTKAPR